MVARALLLRPRLIVADEPVSMVDASLRATILGSLRKLNAELGISILYITHDLATAYQIADTILVLYRASVVEAGDVELVVKAPRHPYTQLLISAIPRVSTVRDWGTEERQPEASPPRHWLQIRRSLPGRDVPMLDGSAAVLSHRSATGRGLLPAQWLADFAVEGYRGSANASPNTEPSGGRRHCRFSDTGTEQLPQHRQCRKLDIAIVCHPLGRHMADRTPTPAPPASIRPRRLTEQRRTVPSTTRQLSRRAGCRNGLAMHGCHRADRNLERNSHRSGC